MTIQPRLDSGAEVFVAQYAESMAALLSLIGELSHLRLALLWNDQVVATDGGPRIDEVVKCAHQDSESSVNGITLLKRVPLDLPGIGDVRLVIARDSLQHIKQVTDGAEIPSETSFQVAPQLAAIIGSHLEKTVALQLTVHNTLHEVHQLLVPIRGAAEYIADKTELPSWPENEAIRAHVLRNVETVASTASLAHISFSNLLRLFSVQAFGEVAGIRSSTINLSDLLSRISSVYRALAAEKGVAINLDIDSNMFLYGDPLLLQQLFHNLLSNAVKYSFGRVPSGSNRFIELGARVHDPGFRTERVQIKIQNYGIGILPHELAHLGKRGFRGSLARAERPIGFGIGVHIAREIARLHDGHIFYDSRPASKEGTSTDASLSQPHIVECLVILPGWRQGEQAAP